MLTRCSRYDARSAATLLASGANEPTSKTSSGKRQRDGFKFRFQASIFPYVADFLCIEAMLIVELDGGQHSVEKDARRTAFLKARGYEIVRFWNNDVIENREGVLEAIHLALLARMAEKKKTLTQPSPAKAGEG